MPAAGHPPASVSLGNEHEIMSLYTPHTSPIRFSYSHGQVCVSIYHEGDMYHSTVLSSKHSCNFHYITQQTGRLHTVVCTPDLCRVLSSTRLGEIVHYDNEPTAAPLEQQALLDRKEYSKGGGTQSSCPHTLLISAAGRSVPAALLLTPPSKRSQNIFL